MPAFIKTKKQEAAWAKAKKKVKEQKNKSESNFSDGDWGLVNHIYQNIIKACQKITAMNENFIDEKSKLLRVKEKEIADREDILRNKKSLLGDMSEILEKIEKGNLSKKDQLRYQKQFELLERKLLKI